MLFPIEWDEPFGLVMIEAMACGTPVLALPGGSVPEIVKNGVSGYVCKDAHEMTQRVSQLADAPMDAAKVRQYVEDHFSVARMVDAYHELYEQMLAGKIKPESAVA